MVDVLEGKLSKDKILSPYSDAVKSYELTWAIRKGGEATYKARMQ